MAVYGLNPKVEPLKLRPGVEAFLFTADSGGVSEHTRRLGILIDRNGSLVDLLTDVTISVELGEYHLWTDASVSNSLIVTTANYVWGDGEAHYTQHRYRITTYTLGPKSDRYTLRDEFVTAAKYVLTDSTPIKVLEAEQQETLVRLKRQR